MQTTEIAWLAGLLEGEGCFTRNTSSPKIAVRMTDLDTIERVADLMDTKTISTYVREGNRKTQYETTIYGQRAITIMKVVRPWMGLRRGNRIDNILHWAKRRPGSGGPRKLNAVVVSCIRFLTNQGVTSARIARAYSLPHQTISAVVRRETYANIA